MPTPARAGATRMPRRRRCATRSITGTSWTRPRSGGSHVKCLATGRKKHIEFESGPEMTPDEMVKSVLKITGGWRFDVVSMGYPGVVRGGAPAPVSYTHLRAHETGRNLVC